VDVPPALTRHRRDVEAFLRTLLDRPGAPLLYRMARYHLGWEDERGNAINAGGKGLRAGLCLLACESSGSDWKTAVPAAAAVELVHSFSLVHDDIQDRDLKRHNRSTVWAVWGNAQAINAGDALLALARLALLRVAFSGVADPRQSFLHAAGCLDQATLEMVEGQALDIEFEGCDYVTVDEYLDMVGRKTGALFGCALSLGAIVAGAGGARVEQFDRLGRTLGAAFQVRDDMLGIWGDEEITGKPVGADLQRRKKSLPVLVALKGRAAEAVRAAYAGSDDVAVEQVLRAMEEAGVADECQRIGEAMQREALALIAAMDLEGDAGRDLAGAVWFLLEREY
jgi:geranylgeranyl diphosphate synthase type I